ncbi:MAG: hypothetical protein LBT74_09810 [Acidobacteriota bacterium]|jgi:hypothetical protein|nr:hypothetical protein [Acidobacteriota bacterium]
MGKQSAVRGLFTLALVGALIVCFAANGFAEDEIAGTTEVTAYYQQYRDFSFKTGESSLDFAPGKLGGVGFSVARNLADWFALWTQLTVYGNHKQVTDYSYYGVQYENSVRLINNLEGIRYQTKPYGPFRFYGKAGAGFTYYSFGTGYGDVSGTRFSAGYGGGADVWLNKRIGVALDVSQILNGLPNLTDLDGRESVDSGMVYTAGLTFRF